MKNEQKIVQVFATQRKAWITDEILHHICKIFQNSCHIKLKPN